MAKTFYVTTPIYYANARPHLGHIYTTLVADSLTRFHRQRGIESFFLTGSDEHGVNIERAAEAQGKSLKQQVDEIVQQFKDAFVPLGIEYDRWVRTTDAYHEESVQNLWRRIDERGFIYTGEYEGWFCGYCNEFKEVEAGIENPLCPEHDRPLDKLAEQSYFFKLSAMQEPLLELYRSRPDFVRPESRLNEVVSFVAAGLKDLSVSRASVKWGVPVPGDPSRTIYVWFDALANYITALGWGNSTYHDFDKFWPGTHLVGKDILRFHAVYWPAFLMAAGIEVPRQVRAHGMWLSGGRKMSKTLGNTIDLAVLYKHFQPDMIRYFVLREMSFGQDGDFTYGALIDRVNSDLADGLGNLASRTLTMVKNYFQGVPPRTVPDSASPAIVDAAGEVRAAVEKSKQRFEAEFQDMNFSRAIEAVWAAIASTDRFITNVQPWKLAKNPFDRADLEGVLCTAYEALRQIVLLTAPVLPFTAKQIWAQMGLPGAPMELNPASCQWGALGETSKIDLVTPAFPKLQKDKIMQEIEKERAAELGTGPESVSPSAHTSSASEGAPTPPAQTEVASTLNPPLAEGIVIDDFVKVDLRVATVLEAERVPKADKLLRLQVDAGEGKPRQILAGIAMHYSPEQMIGRKIIIVANLAPRKLRGFESNGMLLAASVGQDGKPVLATFAEDVPNGARLK